MAEPEQSESARERATGEPAPRAASDEERAEAEQLERAVYGKPIHMYVEPSIGTEDTPARTDELLPIHPGGITKQGDDLEREPHLPRVVGVGAAGEREMGRREQGEPEMARRRRPGASRTEAIVLALGGFAAAMLTLVLWSRRTRGSEVALERIRSRLVSSAAPIRRKIKR